MVERVAGGRGARTDAQFAVNRGEVRIHGAATDDELLRDLRVAQSLRQQA